MISILASLSRVSPTHLALCCFVLATLPGCSSAKRRPIPAPVDLVLSQEPRSIAGDKPELFFDKVFASGVTKDEMETSSEYSSRMDRLGVSGQQALFLVSPSLCEVMAFPDQGFYVVHSRDAFFEDLFVGDGPSVNALGIRRRAITISLDLRSDGSYEAQNAFGARFTVEQLNTKARMLSLDDLDVLPESLKWTKQPGDPVFHFGLSIRTSEPDFRALLKSKKIGLAIRGRFGDIAKGGIVIDGTPATVDKPRSYFSSFEVLPFVLDEVCIVDFQSMRSVTSVEIKRR